MRNNKLAQEIKVVRGIFRDYKLFINETNNIKQSLTSSYDNVRVQGGFNDGQRVVNQILDRADKEQYIKSVDEILRTLPSTYRKIIINRFLRRLRHDDIINMLGIDDNFDIANATYYRWFGKSVEMFYDEALARMVEMEVK